MGSKSNIGVVFENIMNGSRPDFFMKPFPLFDVFLNLDPNIMFTVG